MKKQNSIMWIQTSQCIVAYELDRPLPKKKNKKESWINGKRSRQKIQEKFC